MEIRDDAQTTTLLAEGEPVARAHRCLVVPDHWWITELRGNRDQAMVAAARIFERLRGRQAEQVNVAPTDVRPDLGRPFFASVGFHDDAADDEGRYPMVQPLSGRRRLGGLVR
jgi:hypothetical protein